MAKPVMLSEEAYNALKAEKRKGESFSDVILRKFKKGNAGMILAYLKERGPNTDLADSVERESQRLRKNLKLEKVEF